MNNDLISREALKKDFKERLAKCDEWIEKAKDKETRIRASAVKAFIAEVIMTIDNAPTVTPDMAQVLAYESGKASNERPQGEWITDDMTLSAWRCNKCLYATPITHNFCPNCGADMQKGGAE